ncbi:IucA/IucC family protein [Streptomyces benahoarensis]|uniref:IucA/IucC family siderophore biosynthesis protein n=1 Tax=Streptomyces benahoarensis TaxID=2595054 RepID=A0A553YC52_9ACTN|nr:IucA/IucC family protein [Streptomyces benahoarensis]TSB15885.1 IucA/IucC family siderophore biosynthesis protein [Streptomyces benahoarensis]TSB26792.1 IucA/IucC family siderophore biosynthesis protein [Streptomyces benahoarensis]
MTTTPATETLPDATGDDEGALLLRVLSALLREDVAGLRTRTTPLRRPDGRWLRLPADGAAGALLLPVTHDGYQSADAARLPLLVREADGARLDTLGAVLAALRAHADPADHDGHDAFAEECRQTLATMRLHTRTRQTAEAALTARYGADPAHWTGPAASPAYDTLAARLDHPVYPTSRGRSGLSDGQLRAYAPEFHPRFALRWLALPREEVAVAGGPGALPALLPTPAAMGLDGLEATHVALPVHPLSLGAPLEAALRERGLTGRAALADRPLLDVVPTLSMRTVAVAADPLLHLKLPLATATLGLRNRRTIKPRTLVDGAAGQHLLDQVIAREPRFAGRVLQADETVYAHAGHEMLAVLCRRYPAGLDDSCVVPLATLLAPAPGGGLVLDRLADRFHDGDPLALLDALFALLLDWQATLFGYGVALESHQQNVSVVLDRPGGGPTRLRLLFKDNDAPRLHLARMRERLGDDAPGAADFDDPRIFTDDDSALAAVFATITVHLCAASCAFGLARAGRAPLPRLLDLVRDRLAEAADRQGTAPGTPGAVLRQRVLDAPALPVKAMVSAGTLLSKERSGAADINKHYTDGPNYLLAGGGAS